MRRLAFLVPLVLVLGACATKTVINAGGPTTTTPAAASAGLGQACHAACGSGDDEKCSMPSPDCPSNLCLVDPTQPIEHLAYCTQDCTSSACPAGYHCEGIVAFENDAVKSACVADPAVCGDGVVELGEACDGDSALGKCSADCQTVSAVCGDGVVQAGEVCDGDTAEGYCAACKSIATPRLTLTDVQVYGDAYVSGQIDFKTTADLQGPIPSAGDASGCGSIQVVEQTTELLRLEAKLCASGGSMTWTFALPLIGGTNILSSEGTWDHAKWQPTAHLESAGKSYDFSGDWGDQLSVELTTIQPAAGQPPYDRIGSILVNYGSAGETFGSLSATFELIPPRAK